MIMIALSGPPGAGKNTIIAHLATLGFIRWSFGEFIPGHEFMRPQLALRRIQHLRASGCAGAVVEVETDEEARLIREQGGQVWHVQRPGHLAKGAGNYKGIRPAGADRGILNYSSIADLQRRVTELVVAMACGVTD